jgi:hypothetical protein
MTKSNICFISILASVITLGWVLYVLVPLFQDKFIPTHDGEYHVIRFAQFFESFVHGHSWFPRWAPGLNSGFGVPLFTFFYPLPNYLSLLLHSIGIGFVSSVKIISGMGYVVGVLFCFLWLRKIFSFIPAVLGTLAYASVPYWFVDIFIRGSVGESLAMGCFTLLLYAIACKKGILIAISSALLILSHNILAMLFIPVAFFYAYITSPFLMAYVFLGIGMTSWFWLPALYERQFVLGLNSVSFRDHFPSLLQLLIPSWGTGFSGNGYVFNQMSFQIGIFSLFVFVWSVIVWIKNRKKTGIDNVFKFLGILFVISIFLMTEYSLVFWKYIQFFSNVQYPWRLLSFVPVVSAFCSAYILETLKFHWIRILIFFAVPVFLSYSYARPVQYEKREDSHYLERKEFTDGTSSLGNSFSTKWLPWQSVREEKKIVSNDGDTQVTEISLSPDRYTFQVNATRSDTIIVHTSYFPGWRVYVDERSEKIDFSHGDIRFKVPPGIHAIQVKLESTIDQKIAYGISFLSLCVLALLIIIRKRFEKSSKFNSP